MVFFSRERVFVASARTYLIDGQRWPCPTAAKASLLVFAIDQGYKSSACSQAECCQLCEGCQGTVWRRGTGSRRRRMAGLKEVLQWLVVPSSCIGVSHRTTSRNSTTAAKTDLYASRSLRTSSSEAGWRRMLGLPQAEAIAEICVNQSRETPAYDRIRGISSKSQ
jgi:hypothetical protein